MASLTLPQFPAARRAGDYIRDLWARREFAMALGTGNLKARNANTALGLFWWVLNPLLLGGVYFLVFGVVFAGRRPDDFLTYLLSGMFVFHFTSQSMTGGANSIIQNAKMLANLRFPRLILPLSSIIESSIGFVVSLGVLMVVGLLSGQATITHRLAYLPAVIIIQIVFNLGLSALGARLAVPFRDVNNLLPYINRIWLYLSPVIWPVSFLADADSWVSDAIRWNPMFHIIGLYRSVLLGSPIVGDNLVWAVVSAIVFAIVGVGAFVKYEGNMVRHL